MTSQVSDRSQVEQGGCPAVETRWLSPEEVAGPLKTAGIDHLVIVTDVPFAHTLRSYFKSRGLFGRGVR